MIFHLNLTIATPINAKSPIEAKLQKRLMLANKRRKNHHMCPTVNQIPLPISLLKNPFANDVAYETWERAHDLLFATSKIPISNEILNFYSLGYYKAQVYNGGHSQLVANMDVGNEIRSPFLIKGFMAGAVMVGAPKFAAIAEDFNNWLQNNPIEAAKQTGFEGDRAYFLDNLDDKFSQLNESMLSQLVELKSSSKDALEVEYIQECIDRAGIWSGDLDALEMVWLLRSNLILPVHDDAYEAVWSALLS